MKKINALLVGMFLLAGFTAPLAFAINTDTVSADGVAGCSSVSVDPAFSLDAQQAICNAAESVAGTSCSAGGHGRCSSPKLNDTMPEANHCICIDESEVVAAE